MKRIVGERIKGRAICLRDGHDVTSAALVWRRDQDRELRREPMTHHSNDRWGGWFMPDVPGRYVYAIEAWTDEFATWRQVFELKQKSGADLTLDAIEGASMLTKAQAGGPAASAILLRQCEDFLQTGEVAPLLTDRIEGRDGREPVAARPDAIAIVSAGADRSRARNGAWYDDARAARARPPACTARSGLHRAATCHRGDGFRRDCLTPIDSDRPQERNSAANGDPGDPTPSGRPKAVTTRCIRTWARSGISASSSRTAASGSTWKSRSTSPCNARPTIPGSNSIRNGSGGGRMDRCAMPRTR